MMPPRIAILNVGLVSSVGLSASATCAALRAGISNPTETRFLNADGEWIMGHGVTLDAPWRARTKLVKMAAMAVDECLIGRSTAEHGAMPVLLCVSEGDRPGRLEGLDRSLLADIAAELGLHFDLARSVVVPMGRPASLHALVLARQLIYEKGSTHVLIVAADTLLIGSTLSAYGTQARLLSSTNPNGFMPGEGAAAVLLGRASSNGRELQCIGLGEGVEEAHINSEKPLRADGLSLAMKRALADAQCQIQDLDFRIADISGEQYFFKEAALAVSRTMRTLKGEFDIWHPADGIGETGAVIGAAMIASAWTAQRKGYANGPKMMLHAAADTERRNVAILEFTGAH